MKSSTSVKKRSPRRPNFIRLRRGRPRAPRLMYSLSSIGSPSKRALNVFSRPPCWRAVRARAHATTGSIAITMELESMPPDRHVRPARRRLRRRSIERRNSSRNFSGAPVAVSGKDRLPVGLVVHVAWHRGCSSSGPAGAGGRRRRTLACVVVDAGHQVVQDALVVRAGRASTGPAGAP